MKGQPNTPRSGVPSGISRSEGESGLREAAIFASVQDCLVSLDADGRILEFNPAAERTFGYSRAQAVGQIFAALVASPALRKAHEKCAAPDAEPSLLTDGRATRADGRKIDLEFSIVRLPLAGPPLFLAQLRDISERRAANDRLRMIESSVYYANDAILITEAEPISLPGPRIIYANQAFTDHSGYTFAELAGKTPRIVQGPKTDPVATAAIRDALKNWRQIRIEVINYRKDGTEFWVEMNIVPVANAKGWYTHWVSIQRDTTESRRARIALEEARDEAERANSAKSEFLSRMSHELRTPLNAILGFSQLLQNVPMAPRDKKGLDQIVKAGWHLLDLINEVLDLSRVESGLFESSFEPVSVSSIIRETCDLVRPLAEAAGIALLDGEGHEEGQWVLADPQRLKQVLLNLLSNGIKYNNREGFVAISCRSGSPDRLCIEVQDSGHGIAPEYLEKIFQPFERLGSHRGIEGTGLGLALSQRLTTAMRGTLQVRSRVGEGTTFTIELLRSSTPPSRLEPVPERKEADLAGIIPPEKTFVILYIEDNLQNLELMELILERQPGVKLYSASQGEIGFELAKKHLPDLILLDLHLPSFGGSEILRRLRATSETRAIPVIIVSADASRAQVASLLTAGANHYITKPFAIRPFLEIVDSFLLFPDSPRQLPPAISSSS